MNINTSFRIQLYGIAVYLYHHMFLSSHFRLKYFKENLLPLVFVHLFLFSSRKRHISILHIHVYLHTFFFFLTVVRFRTSSLFMRPYATLCDSLSGILINDFVWWMLVIITVRWFLRPVLWVMNYLFLWLLMAFSPSHDNRPSWKLLFVWNKLHCFRIQIHK